MNTLSRPNKAYICTSCNKILTAWAFKCPDCGKWGSLAEKSADSVLRSLSSDPPALIKDVPAVDVPRLPCGIPEFDRILGGGVVKGSAVLIGGDPGIGKSTILLQVCDKMSKIAKVLYVTAEESVRQSKLRAERLGVKGDIWLVAESDCNVIAGYIDKYRPDLVVIDSIQMIYKPEISSAAGSLTQVRETAMDLTYLCKKLNAVLFLVGHITKDGSLAGPKTLEHLVDTVLYFEGERLQSFRLLRAVKNRFGATNEIGIFDMKEKGLAEVDPAEMLSANHLPGTVVAMAMAGTRPLMLEIQALITKTATPSINVSGVDPSRVNMIMTVLEHLGLLRGLFKVYVNAVGGVKSDDTAVDLAIAMAILSSYLKTPVAGAFAGELGLNGEIRQIGQVDTRINEARRLKLNPIVVPKSRTKADDLLACPDIEELYERIFTSRSEN